MTDDLPLIYIRIDVAHYLKSSSDFFKTEKKEVKRFFLFAIGQIVLSRNKKEATKIIEAILLISTSETAGEGAESLKRSVDFDDHPEGILKSWAMSMEKKVTDIIQNEVGDDLNPRHFPKVSKHLLEHLKTIPVWSCIRRDDFKYGRVPASSSSVEIEFKTLKKQILTSRVRIYMAVETIVKYYNGKLKLIDCSIAEKDKQSIKDAEDTESITDSRPVKKRKVDRIPLKDLSSVHNTLQKTNSTNENEDFSDARLGLNEIENWRGLGKMRRKNKKSLYLGKGNHNLNDIIFSKKCRKLPIIKNGNVESLNLVPINNVKLSLYNTCPFDTFEIKTYVEQQKAQNLLFEMVLEVDEKNFKNRHIEKGHKFL